MRFPIGIQNFRTLREDGYLYIDKTELIYKLVDTGCYYLLSRPRRFGKSLLVSTLEAYFQGKKEQFKGLAMERLEKDWTARPVFHLDLNVGKYESTQSLLDTLNEALTVWEQEYGAAEAERNVGLRFKGVVQRAYEKTGHRVAILVDEYDKPLLQNIGNNELQEELRGILRLFYSVLKTQDRYIKFGLLTGVSKFSKLSVFSDLNQLNDISMKPAYATVCGITKDELVETFTPEIDNLGEKNGLTFDETVCRLTALYDGYHFEESAEGVFNPFSLLNVFDSYKFDNYWFQTGTPTYLVDLLKQSDYDLRLLIDGVEVQASAFSEYRAEIRNPLPMIYQSGYLTIKGYDKEVSLYTLGFPNDEVRYGFLNFLIPYYTEVSDAETGFYIVKFMRELRSGNVDAFMERLKVFFAGMPYELSENTERHYQAIFYVVFTLMGQFVETEVRSARGRADAVVKTKDFIFVFEFKLNGTAEEALKQIDEKGYLIPYTLDGRKLVKVGVNFSKEKRNIDCYVIG